MTTTTGTVNPLPKRPPPDRSRHKWSDPVRYPYKTERTCLNGCGIVRVTQHPDMMTAWREFYRDGERIEGEGTPGCDAGGVAG